MLVIYTRVNKLSDSDTILYEIYMLRFAASKLARKEWENSRDAWVYLESFLVHYRNLIEFLGRPEDQLKTREPKDIHITNVWSMVGMEAPSWVDSIHTEGRALFQKYEKNGARISQYLQHCTTQRTEEKFWYIDEMTSEIEPLLSQIEKELRPTNPELKAVLPVQFNAPHPASTTVVTPTAAVPVSLKSIESPGVDD